MAENEPQVNITTTISAQMQAAVAHVNVKPEVIVITEDKMWKCLTQWRDRIEGHGKWIAPLSLFSALLFCFVTSTFHDSFGIPKDTWRAIAMVGIAGSFGWLLWAVYRRISAARSQSGSVEDLIEIMKHGATTIPPAGEAK